MSSRQLIEKGRREVQKACSSVKGKRRVRSEQSHRQEKLEGAVGPWVLSRPPLRTIYELFNSWEFRWEMTSHACACNLRIQDKGTAPRGFRASILLTCQAPNFLGSLPLVFLLWNISHAHRHLLRSLGPGCTVQPAAPLPPKPGRWP